MNREKLKKYWKFGAIGLVALLVVIQFIPLSHTDPPVTQEIQWDSLQTAALAREACYDCHSNETVWPWYAYVAPLSWRVANHVYDGRRHLNFSEWDRPNEDGRRIVNEISSGRMPPWDYVLLHPEAKLTKAEEQALIDGLQKTVASDPPVERPRRRAG